MAKRAAKTDGVPFYIGGLAVRETIWKVLEGMYNLGIDEIKIVAPPRPELAPVGTANGGATSLLPAPQRPSRRDIVRQIAEAGGEFTFSQVGAAMAASGYTNSVADLLRRMAQEGLIKRRGYGKYILKGAKPTVGGAVTRQEPKPQSATGQIVAILKNAYPGILANTEIRRQLAKRGHAIRDPASRLLQLAGRKIVKRHAKGQWLYVPPADGKE